MHLVHGNKLSLETEDTDKHKVEEIAILFPPTKPKANNNYNESFRDFNEEQWINEVNDNDRGSYEPPDKNSHDYRSRSRSPEDSTHRERHRYDTTEGIAMIAIQAGQIVVIIISKLHPNVWKLSYF